MDPPLLFRKNLVLPIVIGDSGDENEKEYIFVGKYTQDEK